MANDGITVSEKEISAWTPTCPQCGKEAKSVILQGEKVEFHHGIFRRKCVITSGEFAAFLDAQNRTQNQSTM